MDEEANGKGLEAGANTCTLVQDTSALYSIPAQGGSRVRLWGTGGGKKPRTTWGSMVLVGVPIMGYPQSMLSWKLTQWIQQPH